MIFAENLSAVGSLLKQQLPQLPPLPGQSAQAQLEKSASVDISEMTLDERIAVSNVGSLRDLLVRMLFLMEPHPNCKY